MIPKVRVLAPGWSKRRPINCYHTVVFLKSPFPPTLWWQGTCTIFYKRRRPQQRGEGIQVMCLLGQNKKSIVGEKRQSPHRNETLSTCLWELKAFLVQGKDIEFSSLKPGGLLSTPSWKIRAGISSLLLHYFIKLLTNKHMETIHIRALITFSFKGMAGPVSSVKNYLNPPLTSNPPSHFPKFLSHAFQRVWLLSLLRGFAHSIHLFLIFYPVGTWGQIIAKLTPVSPSLREMLSPLWWLTEWPYPQGHSAQPEYVLSSGLCV